MSSYTLLDGALKVTNFGYKSIIIITKAFYPSNFLLIVQFFTDPSLYFITERFFALKNVIMLFHCNQVMHELLLSFSFNSRFFSFLSTI